MCNIEVRMNGSDVAKPRAINGLQTDIESSGSYTMHGLAVTVKQGHNNVK